MTTSVGPVFSVDETHKRALQEGSRLIAHSQSIGWHSLYAAIHDPPIQCTEPAPGHPSFIYHLGHPTNVTRKIEGDRREKAVIEPRRICLTPGNSSSSFYVFVFLNSIEELLAS